MLPLDLINHVSRYGMKNKEKDDNKDMKKNKLKGKQQPKAKTKGENTWAIKIVIYTMIISSAVSLISEFSLSNVNAIVAFFILIFIILIGVVFDIVGTAVTAANETPFHAMASKRIKEAKIAVKLIRNASKVSNFCNDVIGDVCGVISGSVGVIIGGKITKSYPDLNPIVIAVGISAVIAASTVGGKALGKKFAIDKSNDILFRVSKIIHFVKRG